MLLLLYYPHADLPSKDVRPVFDQQDEIREDDPDDEQDQDFTCEDFNEDEEDEIREDDLDDEQDQDFKCKEGTNSVDGKVKS